MEAGEDLRTIPGMWVKQDGEIYRNELGPLENELDNLPFPEKQLWWEYGCFKDNLEVFTGRGCPFKCTFCNIHYQRELFGGKGDFLRKRSVGNVIAELKENVAATTSTSCRCTTTTSRPSRTGWRSSARRTARR